ncbi:PREDICTED: phospholipid scramblase 2 isoform X2 [Rhinopithecus bieti]|uniref:phospholipid scramblase 2 isoform X2 n=1 Tax=Rhinopithecus bieti TaxID=61621 RepID=UPI00083C6348|nr:PREDICTED: phospholipid scramblase 2 isoform X2 [Rhinopithecus bieti]
MKPFQIHLPGSSRHIVYPKHQAGHIGKQAGHLGSQAFYPGGQHSYLVPPAGAAGIPVQNQPGRPAGVPWMPAPPPPLNCPPGLEYLSQIDMILIHQQIELLEAEDTNFCTRNCCGRSRPFTLRITDNVGREVITLERPLRCNCCCCPCCLQEIEIQAPPGVPVGYVTQTWHPCLTKFTIKNQNREDVLKISGPCIVCSCFAGVDFEITSLDEQTVVGRISKHWSGLLREAFTDADNFGIQFPRDLDVKLKAVMIGACFLIDYMFFERTR